MTRAKSQKTDLVKVSYQILRLVITKEFLVIEIKVEMWLKGMLQMETWKNKSEI